MRVTTGAGAREMGATLLAGAGGTLTRIGGGAVVRRGAAGGVDLMGATAMPTMSSSSRFKVAARSRIGEALMSAGPDEAGAGTEDGGGGATERAAVVGAGATEVRGRGIDGRTLALMNQEPASLVPARSRRLFEKILHDPGSLRGPIDWITPQFLDLNA